MQMRSYNSTNKVDKVEILKSSRVFERKWRSNALLCGAIEFEHFIRIATIKLGAASFENLHSRESVVNAHEFTRLRRQSNM